MKYAKNVFFKLLFLFSPLLMLAGNVQATNYLCNADRDRDGVTYGVKLNPLPILPNERPFLTQERIAMMRTKMENSDPTFKWLSKMAAGPRLESEVPSSAALAYRLTGEQRFLDEAKRQFNHFYQSEDPEFGWLNGCNPNPFRHSGKVPVMYYLYLYDELSVEERELLVSQMALRAEYWIKYIEGKATKTDGKPQQPQRMSDTDEVSMTVENFLWYGYALRGTELSERLYKHADRLFEEHVISRYLEGMFEGGVWGEGPEYSANTNNHWALAFMLNQELRPDVYASYAEKGWDPQKYFNAAIEGYIYTTLPGWTNSWMQGGMQYPQPWFVGEEHRLPNLHQSMSILSGFTTSVRHQKLANWYMADLKEKYNAYTSHNTGLWAMLFKDPSVGTLSPQTAKLPTTFIAEGPNLIHTRSSWSDDASALYLSATQITADHMNRDTMAFDLYRKGHKLSTELTGYDGDTSDAITHNMILIETPENYKGAAHILANGGNCDGCPSPDGLPLGDGEILRHSESANYNYAAVDGTLPFNSSKAEWGQYIPHVSRQIATIKPDAYIVFDNVITDKTKWRYDFRWDFSMLNVVNGEYIRDVSYVQHFQSEPIKDTEGFLLTQEPILDQQLKFKTLLPENPATTIVDENELWGENGRNSSSENVPIEQRKWHIRVRPQERQEQVKFLSAMFAGDEGQVVTPKQSIVLSKDAGNIPSDSADVTGVALEMADEWHVVIFPDRPDLVMSEVGYDVSFIPEGAVIHHYVNGMSDDPYYYAQNEGVYSYTSSPGTQVANNNGTLYQRTQNGMPYQEWNIPSAPTGFVLTEANATELAFSWTPSTDDSFVAGYAIYHGSDTTNAQPFIKVSGPSFTDTALSPSTSYTYTVTAFDLDGNESWRSDPFVATTKHAEYRTPIPVRDWGNKEGDSTSGEEGGSTSGEEAEKPATPKVYEIPHPEIKTAAFEMPVDAIEGVYPVPDSIDVDPQEALLLIDFTKPFDFKYSRYGRLWLTDLETGEVVFSIDPELGDEDDQGGFVTTRYVLKLPEGILKANTNYSVTARRMFASISGTPYKSGAIENDQWTFKTSATDASTEQEKAASFQLLNIEGSTPEVLLKDGDFEQGVNVLNLGDPRISGSLVASNAISGNYSVDLAFQPHSRALIAYDYPWGAEIYSKAVQAYAQVRMPAQAMEGSILQLCAITYYLGNTKDTACTLVEGDPSEVVQVEAVLEIDPTKVVRRGYMWFQYRGKEDQGTYDVTVDDLNLVMYRTNLEQ